MSNHMKYREYENSYQGVSNSEGMGCLIITAIPFIIFSLIFIKVFIVWLFRG